MIIEILQILGQENMELYKVESKLLCFPHGLLKCARIYKKNIKTSRMK